MARADSLLAALKQSGRRLTDQRRIICEYLAANKSHPSAYQVYAEIATHHPEISRATVYNTLNVLLELGAIVEVGFGDGHTHYETDTSPHVNLVCLRCHTIEDYPAVPALAQMMNPVPGADFQPVAVKLEVFGFCAKCRELKKAEIRAQWRAQHSSSDSQQDRRPIRWIGKGDL